MNEARYRAAEQRLWRARGVVPSERRIALARNGVDARIQQVGEGPPVLFIHGANTSGASWASLASKLTDFRCLILDRPGTGLSAPILGPLDEDRVRRLGDTMVEDVLDALGIDAAHVVATSLGGYMALRSAAAAPGRVIRMVQFSWPVGAPTSWLPWIMRINAIPGMGRLIARLPASERSARMTFRQIGHAASLQDGRITPEDLETYLALLRDTRTLQEDQRLAATFLSLRRGLNGMLLPPETLARVRTSTHFIWGEHDPFGGAETAERLVVRLPNASLEVVPAAGHAPWLDELDRCADSVRAHLVGVAAH
jgi:4,5:9,10-diseco-3-hydroxy-5,9,17-trioxoandrosta-1(10),2-diene-4-oate hydrolase